MEPSIRVTKEFSATVIIDNRILSNKYDLCWTVTLVTEDFYEQKIAYDRIKFLTDSMLEGTIFTKYNNPLLKKIVQNCNNTYCQLHDQPYDATIVDYVFLKGQSLLEGKALIDSVSLSSWQGREIEFTSDAERDYSEYNKCKWTKGKTPWYLRSDIFVGDYPENKELEIPVWEDIGLGWKCPPEEDAEIIHINKFRGKVIKGGLSGNK